MIDSLELGLIGASSWALPGLAVLAALLLLMLWNEISRRRSLQAALQETQAQLTTVAEAKPIAELEEVVRHRSRELVEAERQLLQNEKLASVGQLAAGIAHEINTPIQYIGDNLRAISDAMDELLELVQEHRAFVELVKRGECSPEAVQQIETSAREHDLDYIVEDTPQAIRQGLEGVERVAHIVRAMKDFSHVQREEVTAADLNHSIESTLTVARNEYKYHADVVTELGEIPPVECFVGEINQVLLNLLVNAAHAIADTQKRGTITIRSSRCGNEQVEISISDTGTGIPPEVQNWIFDPFFTTKEIGKGTGQGLNMAHQTIVRKHGGTLTFDTQVGAGTTFYIRLPVRAQVVPEPDEEYGAEGKGPVTAGKPPADEQRALPQPPSCPSPTAHPACQGHTRASADVLMPVPLPSPGGGEERA